MILADQATPSTTRATLDDLFRRAVARRPQATALVDPPDRARVTDGLSRRLNYAEADKAVSTIANRLRGLGLQTDAVVAVQLPNTVESVLALLGILRAGMIAAPLPLLWRRQDAVAALGRIGAKAFITAARIGQVRHADIAMHVASELFAIRHVGAFGRALPDGITLLDDVFTQRVAEPVAPVARSGNPAAHLAVITFDVTPAGLVPVARSHLELISGGLATYLEGRFAPDAIVLSGVPAGSFAGFALTLMPWLLSGGTLALHHPFDADVFAEQFITQRCGAVVLPGPMVARMADAGHIGGDELQTVIALWRAPERLGDVPAWRGHAGVLDVSSFGEVGLVVTRRPVGGTPAAIPLGPIGAPQGAASAVLVGETGRTETGTLAMRGPMVPTFAFPPGAEHGAEPHLKLGRDGFVDTGHACRIERDERSRALIVTGPPPGLSAVGGYRFRQREIDAQVESLNAGASLVALPDGVCGQRLAGSSPDMTATRAELERQGVNPLIANAFRERGAPRAA